MQSVPFILYEASMKRYGYLGYLNDNTLNEVAAGINTSVGEISGEEGSLGIGVSSSQLQGLTGLGDVENVKGKYYRHPKIFDQGNYDLSYMLALGFVMCVHNKKEEKALDMFWALVNPKIDDSVSKEVIEEWLNRLVFWSVIAPLNIEQKKEVINPEMVKYLEGASGRSAVWVENKLGELPAEVTREHMLVIGKEILNSASLRAAIHPERATMD